MPMPKPNDGENRVDFIGRCMSDDAMIEEYSGEEQRMAVCSSQWEERAVRVNEKLLSAVRKRGQKQTEFAHGIHTADKFVRTMLEAVGSDACYRAASTRQISFNDVLEKSAKTLVYSNPDMTTEGIADGSHLFKEFMEGAPDDVEIPKNTLILFRHCLTTPRKDRDGDILRTKGATVDPKMLLLWQHVHTLPLGPYLFTSNHDDKALTVVSAIVDMNELCHDAAVMIDNKMGRFSHGFRALEFIEIKADDSDPTAPGGFDVKRFEIMEESLVSVPSNVDAETEEVLYSLTESGKLTSPLMKEWGRAIKEKRPVVTPGVTIQTTDGLNVVVTKSEGEKPDEKQSRARSQASGEGRAAGTPKEADDGGEEAEEKDSQDAEVKEARPGYGSLEGSWEWTNDKLKDSARSYLTGAGVSIGEKDWVWIVGVYPDHGIICAERCESGGNDEFRYFKAGWELEKGEPKFVGEPKAVEVKVNTEVMERSPSYGIKEEKSGRTISKANEEKIKDAVESIVDAAKAEGVPRAVKSMLREAAGTLRAVLSSLGSSEQETSTPTDIEKAMAYVLGFADPEQIRSMIRSLQGLDEIDRTKQKTREFRSLIGSGTNR